MTFTCTLDVAACYQAEGWAVIPIPRLTDPLWAQEWAQRMVPAKKRGKVPLHPQWQHIKFDTYEDLQNGFDPDKDNKNIGVRLGAPSGGLVDLDLDCEEAVAVVRKIFPLTRCFGRKSNPESHWLYVSDAEMTRKWTFEGKTLLELRTNGAQTVFPGSIHPSGERVEWVNYSQDLVFIGKNILYNLCEYVYNSILLKSGAKVENVFNATNAARIKSNVTINEFNNYNAAVSSFCANNELPTKCPYCDRKDAWKVKEGKWFCFHANHPDGFGGVGRGCHCGDAVDIAAYLNHKTRGELLRTEGYWPSEEKI
jgi:hypothetical protein